MSGWVNAIFLVLFWVKNATPREPFVVPSIDYSVPMTPDMIEHYREEAKKMFYHGYDSYMKYAFPHDELKPLSGSYTDSLGELGNSRSNSPDYEGIALTLIDTLDTLAVLGNKTEFKKSVNWVTENISFDIDLRVHIFECNIRLLGGLLSAHILASDEVLNLMDGEYNNKLLDLAEDLALRLLPAFETSNGIPYAWVNLRHGVVPNETRDTCVAGVGTLLLEFGLLSHLTNNDDFYNAAHTALRSLWNLKSPLDLLGNTLDGATMQWKNPNAGIGAGVDSFYEYLFKSYVLFGNTDLLDIFDKAYKGVMKYLKNGPWYFEAHMKSGRPSHYQFNSLQAFWPALQVLAGHIEDAELTFDSFFGIWKRYGALPERYLLSSNQAHSTEHYYPLRPELIESSYYLFTATGDHKYLHMGSQMLESLNNISRVEKGYASVKNVKSQKLEDRMTSFFLSETCKYLYLLFDPNNFLHSHGNYLFNTEGHLIPLSEEIHTKYGNLDAQDNQADSEPLRETCWLKDLPPTDWKMYPISMPHSEYYHENSGFPRDQCINPKKFYLDAQEGWMKVIGPDGSNFKIGVGEGSFHIISEYGEIVEIRNLGTGVVEITNQKEGQVKIVFMDPQHGAVRYELRVWGCGPQLVFDASRSFFGPDDDFESLREHGLFLRASLTRGLPALGCTDPITKVKDRIVMLDRGACTFVDKIALLQSRRAKGVIIANHVDVNNLFMMGGDESGRKVNIPALMITSTSATQVERCLVKGKELTAEFYQIPQEENGLHIAGDANNFVVTTLGKFGLRVYFEKNAYHLEFVR